MFRLLVKFLDSFLGATLGAILFLSGQIARLVLGIITLFVSDLFILIDLLSKVKIIDLFLSFYRDERDIFNYSNITISKILTSFKALGLFLFAMISFPFIIAYKNLIILSK